MPTADEQVLAAVERKVSALAYTLNSTGFGHALRHDERLQAARAQGVTAATQLMAEFANGRVHNSLSLIEKLGFDPFGRVAQRKRYAAAAVGVAQFSLQMGIDLLVHHLDQRVKRQAVANYASWLGFAHGAPATARMAASIARQEHEMGLAASPQAIGAFEAGVGAGIAALPRPQDRQTRFATLLEVAGAVDTTNGEVAGRLAQLASLSGVPDGLVDSAIEDFNAENEVESDVVGLAGSTVALSLQDVFSHAGAAYGAATATFENDPFAALRAERRNTVKSVGPTVAMAGLTFLTGGIGDFLLVAAAPVVHAAIGSPDDVRQMLRVARTLRANLTGTPSGGRHG